MNEGEANEVIRAILNDVLGRVVDHEVGEIFSSASAGRPADGHESDALSIQVGDDTRESLEAEAALLASATEADSSIEVIWERVQPVRPRTAREFEEYHGDNEKEEADNADEGWEELRKLK